MPPYLNQRIKVVIIVFFIWLISWGTVRAVVPIAGETMTAAAITQMIAKFFTQFWSDIVRPSHDKNTGKVMTAIAAAADSQTKTIVEVYNAKAVMDSASPKDFCHNETIASATRSAEIYVRSSMQTLQQRQVGYNINTKHNFATENRQLSVHRKQFCGPQDNGCTTGKYPNADINANVFYADQYDETQKMAALLFTNYVTNPTPTPQLPDQAKNTLLSNAMDNAMLSESARLSLSQQSFYATISDRTPTEIIGKTIGKPKASPKELRDFEVNKRYNNEEWIKRVDAEPFAATIKDIAHMTAYRLKQEEQQTEILQRIELLLASINAQQTKEGAKTQIAEIREKASKAIK